MKNHLTQFVNCEVLRDHKIIKEDLWIVEGGQGYDFSFPENTEEGVNVVSKSLLRQGVTSYCPTLVTSPKEIYHKVLPKIKKRRGDKNGATILGVHGISTLEEIYGSLDNVKIITLAPEFENSTEVIKALVERKIVVSLGHSTADLAVGEEAVKDGASLITHLFNAMLPFHHRDPGLVGLLASTYVSNLKRIYFGIISDGIHTHPAALRIAYRIHPKGLILVTDAISATGLEEGQHKIGQMAVEIIDSKAYVAGTNTLCGSTTSMIECVKLFISATGCPPEYALEAASLHPAKALGIENEKGTLHFGADADFVFLTSSFDVASTWIAGDCVYECRA
ncbi:hypothetical protein NQ315_016462 [Exocentrus adspersus]|uniref:N-acetylglucosamine-6-phosphate deacetylase n=1 Tax=Exocentrus adspersus TaxID=1586481 RepID=A0AAV8VYR3_9CUCU|nr:hypothetical protein NQ315_016462 [Exocentrus adspersus]